jgi:hypothetical protein
LQPPGKWARGQKEVHRIEDGLRGLGTGRGSALDA